MDATVCPVHGRRDQDGYFVRKGERACNAIVRKTFGGVPILCSEPLTETPRPPEAPADVLRSIVAWFDERFPKDGSGERAQGLSLLVERARRTLEAEDG